MLFSVFEFGIEVLVVDNSVTALYASETIPLPNLSSYASGYIS